MLERNTRRVLIGSIALGLTLGVMAVIPSAQTTPQFTRSLYRSAFAKEQKTVSTASVTLTSATFNPAPPTGGSVVDTRAEFADIMCDTHPIRVWMDGSAPTAAIGIEFFPGTIYTLQGYHDILNFHAISADGSDATCNVQYYRFRTNTQ